MITRVYLDNCCFNRPFDDQFQLRIRLETEAKLYIQENICLNKLELVWSYVMDFENASNPFEERAGYIDTWREKAVLDIEESDDILELVKEISSFGLKSKDALHVAAAIEGKCSYFFTTDDGILKKMRAYKKIKVMSPVEFITGEMI